MCVVCVLCVCVVCVLCVCVARESVAHGARDDVSSCWVYSQWYIPVFDFRYCTLGHGRQLINFAW